jgi:hypothetical protein
MMFTRFTFRLDSQRQINFQSEQTPKSSQLKLEAQGHSNLDHFQLEIGVCNIFTIIMKTMRKMWVVITGLRVG